MHLAGQLKNLSAIFRSFIVIVATVVPSWRAAQALLRHETEHIESYLQFAEMPKPVCYMILYITFTQKLDLCVKLLCLFWICNIYGILGDILKTMLFTI